MPLRSRTLRRSLLVAVASAALTASTLGALPGHARPATPAAQRASEDTDFDILVLGDSFSAGNGAGSYYGQDGCYRSSQNYGGWVAEELKRDGIPASVLTEACSGAVAKNIWSKRDFNSTALRPQADAITSETDLVLLTIGGNDAQFSNIVKLCLLNTRGPTECALQLKKSEKMLSDGTLEARIRGVLDVISGDLVPEAGIGLLGYPMLEGDPNYSIGRGRYKVKVGQRLRDFQTKANKLQASIIASYSDPDRFHFFDVQPLWDNPFRGLYAGKGDDSNTWLVQAGSSISPATYYHPTPDGWAAEGRMVAADPWTRAVADRADVIGRPGVVYGQAPAWGERVNIESYREGPYENEEMGTYYVWSLNGAADVIDNARGERYTMMMQAVQDPGSPTVVGMFGNPGIVPGSKEATGVYEDAHLPIGGTTVAGRVWCMALVSVYVEGHPGAGGQRSEFSQTRCHDNEAQSVPEPDGLDWDRFYEEYYPACSTIPCPQPTSREASPAPSW